MRFRIWWIYFLFLVLAALLMGLGATTYLLYRQHKAIGALAEDAHLMLLRTERLESLVQEQEVKQVLAQQEEAEAKAKLKKTPEASRPAVKQAAASKAAPPKSKEPPEEKPKPASKPEAKAVKPAAAKAPPVAEPAQSEKPQAKVEQKPGPKTAQPSVLAEPTSSDVVGVKDVSIDAKAGSLIVRYKVANAKAPEGKAMGYTMVIARGERAGKPWIEASPPMRLTPLGRPLNYKRGTPFSVQYHRPIKAKFVLNDKKIQRLEFLVYSREGALQLVQTRNLNTEKAPPDKTEG